MTEQPLSVADDKRIQGTLVIDKNIDLPTKMDALLRRGPRRKYPFPDMKVGDSFAMPDPKEDKGAFERARLSVNVFNSQQRKKAAVSKGVSPKVMVVGEGDDGVWRCWRQT